MPPLDLDAIEKRANAATVGPWTHSGQHGRFDVESKNQPIASADARDNADAMNNVAFISHARTDVLALTAEVRRLRDALRYSVDTIDNCMVVIRDEDPEEAEEVDEEIAIIRRELLDDAGGA